MSGKMNRELQMRACVWVLLMFGFVITAWAEGKAPKRSYEVPSIDEITRVDVDGQGWPEPKIRSQSLYSFVTEAHVVEGEAYVVVTDHVDEAFLAPLRRLVEFHKGVLLTHKDFGDLGRDPGARKKMQGDLKAVQPRFIALAPREENFRENVVLAFLDVIASLDADPELDAFPGWLVAPDAESFGKLIDQTIAFKPSKRNEIKAFTLCQVSAKEFRSQQKACIMDDYFDSIGLAMPSLSVRTRAPGINKALRSAVGDEDDWVIGAPAGGRLLPGFPSRSKEALDQASLLMIYGHGAPGKICAMSLDAFDEIDFSEKIVFSGACFSALPRQSDFPVLQRGPDGEPILNHRERLIERFVSGGAIGVLAHMRLSDGFPSVLPVFESMMQGLSAGESVQRLLNAAIRRVNLERGYFCLAGEDRGNPLERRKRNALLWVMVGDPALRAVAESE